MNAKPDMKRKAEALRRKGLSYNEIRRQVPVSKASLSMWLKHIRLSPGHRARLYTKKISVLTLGTQSQKERRKREVDSIIEQAASSISKQLAPETIQLLGAALYWAEGTKKNNFEIANSDPLLIAFMVYWFGEMFDTGPKCLKARLNIYSQQDEKALKKFWSDITGIPVCNFGKSYIKPPGKGYKKNTLYYGTMRVRVPRGTDMRWKVYGWVKGALQDIAPHIQSTQQRWSKLQTARPPVNIRP